jgi:hypothetical protein
MPTRHHTWGESRVLFPNLLKTPWHCPSLVLTRYRPTCTSHTPPHPRTLTRRTRQPPPPIRLHPHTPIHPTRRARMARIHHTTRPRTGPVPIHPHPPIIPHRHTLPTPRIHIRRTPQIPTIPARPQVHTIRVQRATTMGRRQQVEQHILLHKLFSG